MALSPRELARYQRHLSLPGIGPGGQARLKSSRVLVIGAGGLGSPAALYLGAAGVGTLGIVDCDRVEISNLQRQVLFQSTDVGRLKAEAARDRLIALNPEITVVAHPLALCAANAREVLESYDIVVDGTDRLATRYLVNDACVLLGKALVTAAIHRFEGQAMTFVPRQGPCYRCLFPEAQAGVAASCADAGVLGVLPGVLGAIQATEAIKLAAGIGAPLSGRLLIYDALELRFAELPVSRRDDCAACGDHPSIAVPGDGGGFCDADLLQSVHRLSACALRDMMAMDRAPGRAPVLIDVREPREFEARHLEGARNIPLPELERRVAEIRGERPAVFLCRSGGRSLTACAIALRAGVLYAAHLEGGLLAWAAEVDPAFEVAPA